ncbi:fumarylacetoacetate hydrolase family protein [Candidatus Uabimicrobium sp. HlEnr_7]|uniref:fumarylacetoacetate hydrolase family protein n=1 Tax=Candidatus Uabimicrobium helgolandensis TaxID=3095367 RepID=UPI003557466F
MYKHNLIEPVGKIVCVGRNYLEHIKELNNPIPKAPIIFMKPSTSFVALSEPISLPLHAKECHHEVEIAVLIAEKIGINEQNIESKIAGYGLALDLTLRDLQRQLKESGHPWEMAKAFDKSCPISPFICKSEFTDLNNISFSLTVNDQVRQQGNSKMMMYGIVELISYICKYFTLLPGDVILTGTPSGVAALNSKDKLQLEFNGKHQFSSHVL